MYFEVIEVSQVGFSVNFTDTLGLMAANGLLDSLGWALIHSLWQGCIAAAIVMAFRGMFKGSAPALRYTVQIAALFGLFLAFISTVLIYQTDIIPSNLNTTKLAFSLPFPSQLSLSTLEVSALSIPPSTPVSDFQIVGEIGQMTPIISLFWVIGFLYLFMRYSAAYLLTRRLRNNGLSSVPNIWNRRFKILLANTGVSTRVELFISDHIQSPMTLGFFKPIVLVPGSFFTGLPAEQVEAILLHEIAHIRRYDYLINLLQLLVKTVFFFHPAVHYISRQIDEDREQACDDISVAQTRNPKALARGLASLRLMQNRAHVNFGTNTPSTTLVMNATGPQESALVHRLKRLIGEDPSARKPEHLVLSALTVILIGVIGLSAAPLQAIASERNNEIQPTSETLQDAWTLKPVSPSENVETPIVKLAQQETTEIPTPPKPPIPDSSQTMPTPPTNPLPPINPLPPVPPMSPEAQSVKTWDTDSDQLAGAPISSPWTSELNSDALNAEIDRQVRRAESIAQTQIQKQIQREVDRQVAHAERQIKHAERQLKISERNQERAERMAEKKAHKAHRSSLETRRFEEKMERAHSKELDKAKRKLREKHPYNYKDLETTLTKSLVSDGLIRSKTENYTVTFSNGRAVVNGKSVSDKLVDKYCEIFNNYGLYKNSKLKITSTADVFTFNSQSKDGQSTQTISIGTYKHKDKSHTSHTHSETKTEIQSHSKNKHKHKHKSYSFIKPITSDKITAKFGSSNATEPFHTGIDISAPLRTPVMVSSNGVVQLVTTEPSWGNRIIIKHEGGYQTIYAHLNDINVSRGQNVQAGMIIGTVGRTGDARNSHLHFEVLKNGTAVNPKTIIRGF